MTPGSAARAGPANPTTASATAPVTTLPPNLPIASSPCLCEPTDGQPRAVVQNFLRRSTAVQARRVDFRQRRRYELGVHRAGVPTTRALRPRTATCGTRWSSGRDGRMGDPRRSSATRRPPARARVDTAEPQVRPLAAARPQRHHARAEGRRRGRQGHVGDRVGLAGPVLGSRSARPEARRRAMRARSGCGPVGRPARCRGQRAQNEHAMTRSHRIAGERLAILSQRSQAAALPARRSSKPRVSARPSRTRADLADDGRARRSAAKRRDGERGARASALWVEPTRRATARDIEGPEATTDDTLRRVSKVIVDSSTASPCSAVTCAVNRRVGRAAR